MLRRPRWGRWMGVGAVLTLVGVLPVAARSTRAQVTPPPLRIQVAYGDSLWTLARKYGDPNRDVRSIILALRHTNHIEAEALQPGQVLLLPAAYLPTTPQ